MERFAIDQGDAGSFWICAKPVNRSYVPADTTKDKMSLAMMGYRGRAIAGAYTPTALKYSTIADADIVIVIDEHM